MSDTIIVLQFLFCTHKLFEWSFVKTFYEFCSQISDQVSKIKLRMETVKEELANQDKIVREPYTYLANNPGKGFREIFSKALNRWLNIKDEYFNIINEAFNILHNASLLIDDIADNSDMRRGAPGIQNKVFNVAEMAHHIFGLSATLNAANCVTYVDAIQKIIQLGNPKALDLLVSFGKEAYRGQSMEMYWRDNFICPTEEEYKQMVIGKTGGIFIMIYELMQLFSDNKSDISNFLKLFSIYFQIRDDYSNLCSEKYTDTKGFCEDITEGKFSFPIIHAIQTNPEDNRIIDILKQRPTDIEVKKEFVGILKSRGSLKYTKNVLAGIEIQMMQEILRLEVSLTLMGILSTLQSWKMDHN